MDHHCPWINNCVGANNQKQFILFVFYTAVASSYLITLVLYYLVVCEFEAKMANSVCISNINDPTSVLLTIITLFFSTFALLFSVTMLANQVIYHFYSISDNRNLQAKAIRTGMGTIERLRLQRIRRDKIEGYRMEGGEYVPLVTSEDKYSPIPLSDIFGADSCLFWMFPIDPHYKEVERVLMRGSESNAKEH